MTHMWRRTCSFNLTCPGCSCPLRCSQTQRLSLARLVVIWLEWNMQANKRANERTSERTNEQMNKRAYEQTNEQTSERTSERTNEQLSERTNERTTNERTNEQAKESTSKQTRKMKVLRWEQNLTKNSGDRKTRNLLLKFTKSHDRVENPSAFDNCLRLPILTNPNYTAIPYIAVRLTICYSLLLGHASCSSLCRCIE